MKVLKPMLPSLVTEIPKGEDWVYEVKYDGFRAMIYLEENRNINIVSRNQNLLNQQFPEIINLFELVSRKLSLPLILDGELSVLEGDLKANFDLIQKEVG
ncbi:hypothetical protein [Anaerobacillus sp. CMMVII]|uniref:ATP-dependent DNA ligase n=1 Tax=Anaerobacillus sp. CMMVII TaxID=2755588 RepID=UPI0021B7333A|nr:hypothetical protein [Anaerobacillus sp. CMMVII]